MKIICRKTFVSLDEEDREALRRASKICGTLYGKLNEEEDFWDDANLYQDLGCTEKDLLKIIECVDRLYPTDNPIIHEEDVPW